MDAIVWKRFDLVTSHTFLYCRSQRGGVRESFNSDKNDSFNFLNVTQRYLLN